MDVRLNTDMRIVCVEVKTMPPMDVMTHWALDVTGHDGIDAADVAAIANREKFGLKKITPCHDQHGVYAFFIQDRDNNWWEIQHTPSEQTNFFLDRGDTPDLEP